MISCQITCVLLDQNVEDWAIIMYQNKKDISYIYTVHTHLIYLFIFIISHDVITVLATKFIFLILWNFFTVKGKS